AKISERALKNDPENVYLSHAPRLKLKAEFVKDLVMASSGLMDSTLGGPSVKPYQPRGLWEQASSGRGELATYKQDTGRALYRRGMYTFIKLTVPPPAMMIFDASNRDQCEVKRLKTSTPLQALVMMNDPMVLEASRVLAQQLLKIYPDDDTRLSNAFQRIISRRPKPRELSIMAGYLSEQRELLKKGTMDPVKVLQVGYYPQPAKSDAIETAALMKTISAIYNLEEAITK
ncbi:MAG TPA: DUF1553 domain-containing protein, partial [Phnomibacter sp.]|nr:DUF1553 domain-containing protein [Phnomibacter sp.]